MKSEEHGGEALTPASRTGLSASRSTSLAARARADLQQKENATEWLRKGIQLVENELERSAEEDGWSPPDVFYCFAKGHELDPTSPELSYWLAHCYRYGIGVSLDEQRALSLYHRAAAFNNASAMTAVGDAHAQISFTLLPENWPEAAKWYRQAAELGDETAIWMIYFCCYSGKGTPQDRVEAARWLRALSDRGSKVAREELKAAGPSHALENPAQ